MKEFEVGKIYKVDCASIYFKVAKRTAKFVTLVEIQHFGKFNERKCEPKKCKIFNWDSGEVAFPYSHELYASQN